MRIDPVTIERARNTEMPAFLENRSGYKFTAMGAGYRCRQHPSFAIKGDRLSWYWHSKGIGGYGLIDYLVKIEGLQFREAVKAICPAAPCPAARLVETVKPTPLILPEKANTSYRLYDYLCRRRGINREIISALLQEGHIYEDTRGNVVFVGRDEYGIPRFASVRGTRNRIYRMDCAGSSKRYSFNITYSEINTLLIYESAIDALSHASIFTLGFPDIDSCKKYNYLSLSGTSDYALTNYLEIHPGIHKLVFCLDNDPAGNEASSFLNNLYKSKGYDSYIRAPIHKDYNDELMFLKHHKVL